MAVNLSPVGGVAAQFFTNTGAVLTGGKLYTYAAGTTTPQTTFTSGNGATPWTNPIVLDAAGRVSGSGEIWLTDGIQYKFVLKDSNDVLIATYDNITGINSNFVNFVAEQEIQTATAGQTVFTLTTTSYQPGTNTLSVFVDGVNQYGPGAQYAYTETSSTVVTFVSGLHVGASVKFTTTQTLSGGATDSSQVVYDPPFTGSVETNVELKLAQYVSVKDFGAVGDGTTDDTAAIQLAINNNQGVFFPEGSYLISSPIQLTQQWVYGVGSDKSIILCNTTHAFTVLSNAGFDRPACVVEKLGINSVSNSCDDKFAFYVPGVASGAAAVYNIGLTIRDVEIGRTGRMGGGFYLKDLFRCNIEDVGLTDVSRMIQVVGSVVQLRASRVLSNNDSSGTALSKYGISTESASYSSGTLGPENCVFENCAYIRGSRGINHTSGLLIYFTNFDTEADSYGALVAAQCTIQGGIFAPGIAANDWTGVYRTSGVSEAYDGTYFIDVDVNTIRVPTAPLSSFGFDFGDGTSPAYGVIMQNCRVRGTANSLNHAIRGRQCRDAIIEGNSIESAICSGTEVFFSLARGLNFNFNRVVGGTVDITDDGDTTATGSVLNNQVGTMALSLTFPTSNNWIVSGNGTTSITRGFGITIDTSGYKFLNLPTSSAGLPSGALWSDSGTVKVA